MERKILRDVIENPAKGPTPPPAPPNPNATSPLPKSSFLSRERREERKGKILAPMDPPPTRRSSKGIWIVILVIAALLVAGVFVASAESRASITVTPREQTIAIDSTLKAYKDPQTPGQLGYSLLEVTDKETTSLPASGTKYVERKASGKITVTNNYSKDPLRLVQNTRFKSADGKIFRAYNSFVVPGNGSADVNVVADVAGAEYNIPAGDFTLPGLAGGPMASKVTGKSKDAMSGGFKGDVKVVSDDDLAKAKSALESTLTTKLLDAVSKQVPDGKIFFPDAYSISFNFNEYAASDSATDAKTQPVSLDGTMEAVIFDKDELSSDLARKELTGVDDQVISIGNWSEMTVNLSHYDDLKSVSDLSLRVSGSAQFVWKFDDKALKAALAGTPKDKYSQVFLNFPGIDRAEVKIHPFWINSFPKNADRITVETKP